MISNNAAIPTLSNLDDALLQIKIKCNKIIHFLAIKVSGRIPVDRKDHLLNISNLIMGIMLMPYLSRNDVPVLLSKKNLCRRPETYAGLISGLKELSLMIANLYSHAWRFDQLETFLPTSFGYRKPDLWPEFFALAESHSTRASAAYLYARECFKPVVKMVNFHRHDNMP